MSMRLIKKLKKVMTVKFFMSLFIVVMMLGSVMGFVLTSGTASTTSYYNGYKVQVVSKGYLVSYGKDRLNFYYSPQDLEFINVSSTMMKELVESPFAIISFDPAIKDTAVLDYARFTLFNYYSKMKKNVVFGVTGDSLVYPNFNTMDCMNATVGAPAIIFKDAEQSSVTYEPHCMIISSADTTHRLRMAELISYHVLGIMK